MINILTIDLEDYFQVSAFENVVKREDWDKYESRIERNTHRLLNILHECKSNFSTNCTNVSPQTSNLLPCDSDSSPRASRLTPNDGVKATFFCLGWIAERYPDLIREIHRQGHEIACHGHDHRLIYNMSRNEFREDVTKSKKILEDIVGEEVTGYRAPSYSITSKNIWAFEVLIAEGFKYDSSVFPIHHDRYGIPDAPRFPFLVDLNGGNDVKFSPCAQRLTTHGQNCLVEFPISTVKLLGINLPISGGGYFRLFPYSLVKKGLRRINEEEDQPFIYYIHPWEIDPDQPRINRSSRKARFRHYVNLDKTEIKLKKLLKDFNFTSLRNILELNKPNGLNKLDKPNKPEQPK
jgi:polysaccharide deacetylase family protein (PEP-CTERM system associated)